MTLLNRLLNWCRSASMLSKKMKAYNNATAIQEICTGAIFIIAVIFFVIFEILDITSIAVTSIFFILIIIFTLLYLVFAFIF